jgi:O-antigen/teichoic acid export membrane protein
MQIGSLARLVNIALRGMTLGSKFLLIFFLARFLTPAELGLYGLLAATIGYALYLLGLDFYTYTTRELLKRPREQWGGLLKDQGALIVVLYAIFLPLLLLIFAMDLLPWHFAGWFIALLALEHLNQELMRLLVAISEQLMASTALFLRSGAWAVVIVVLMFLEPATRNIEAVFAAWTIGGLSACLLACVKLSQLRMGGWRKRIDWAWIQAGIKVALPFLVATLAIRGVYTLDRYWLEALSGLEVLGAYVLFIGIANAMMSFLDAGVFAFSYPGLIRAFQQNRPAEFRQELKRLITLTVVLSGAFSIAAWLLIDPLLSWLDKPLYIEQKDLFPWVLLATFLYALGMIPHYALYAQSRDKPIIYSHIVSLVVFIVATWLVSLHWSNLAVPIGLCIAFFSILVWKSYAYFRLAPSPFRPLQS